MLASCLDAMFLLISLFFINFFKFYFVIKLYIIVLVLPNIKMNLPQVMKKIVKIRSLFHLEFILNYDMM